jgi:predicted branched-subunit amino acid permease
MMAIEATVLVGGPNQFTEIAEPGFRRGFVAMLPLWTGAIPSGIAYGVAAHAAGWSPFAAQVMSLTVFAAPAQFVAVERGTDSSVVLMLANGLALNAHLPLLGLAVAKSCRSEPRQRLLTAWFLADGAFGIASSLGPLRLPALLGAEVSMYAGWNLGTAIGLGSGSVINGATRGLDLVVPLSFAAVLDPMLRGRTEVIMALIARGLPHSRLRADPRIRR